MRISKKIVSILLLVAMLITSFPINTVYAGNNDSLPSNPSVGKGSSDWKYAEDWEGVRVSLYWAESEDHFKRNENVVQIGETKDFSKTNPRYQVNEYTTYSIYRYMNGDNEGRGKSYKPELDIINPYYYVDKNDSSVVSNLPPVWNGTKEQWDNWVEGDNYKNIEEISRLLGQKVTAEDFMSGDLVVDGYQVKSKGFYKLFIEPLHTGVTVAGKGMVLTLRDAIRWEEAFNRGEIKPASMIGSSGNPYTPSLTMNLLPIFEYLGNSQFLIEDEPAISMTANSSNYRVDGSTGSAARREEIRKEIKKGGKIYNSLGVGVFTSPNIVPENEAILAITYVKVVGINADGSLKYEQIKQEVVPAELDENGKVLNIKEVIDIEEGTAYLNDMVTSPKDLTEGNIKWEKDLPESDIGVIEPNANDVWRYNLGILAEAHKALMRNISSEDYQRYKSEIERIESILKKGTQASKLEISEVSILMVEITMNISTIKSTSETNIIKKQ